MRIKWNSIIYTDHIVILDPELHVKMAGYVIDMSEMLSEDGSMEDHIQQLEIMNNDGSWRVEPLLVPHPLVGSMQEEFESLLQGIGVQRGMLAMKVDGEGYCNEIIQAAWVGYIDYAEQLRKVARMVEVE